MGDAAAPFLCALQKFVSAQASDVNGSNVAHDPGAVGGVGLRLDDPADNQRSVAAPVLEQKCDFRSRIGAVKPRKRPGRYGMVFSFPGNTTRGRLLSKPIRRPMTTPSMGFSDTIVPAASLPLASVSYYRLCKKAKSLPR